MHSITHMWRPSLRAAAMPGVRRAEVNYANREARIAGGEVAALIAEVDAAGYSAHVPATSETQAAEQDEQDVVDQAAEQDEDAH